MIMIIAPLHICLLAGTLLLCLRITAQHEPMFRKDYTDSTKAKTDLYVFVGEQRRFYSYRDRDGQIKIEARFRNYLYGTKFEHIAAVSEIKNLII
jgi:hypothetical protein